MRKRKVVITNIAATQLQDLVTYLEEEWSEQVKKDFLQKLYRVSRLIAQMPEMFPKSKHRPIRKCVVTEQVSITYKYTKTQVTIISLIDNRQKPESDLV